MSDPAASELDFGKNIIIPLAQITVVDGDEGDCNVVDFCGKPLVNRKYQDDSWRRTIIDTGPASGRGRPRADIVNTLCFLADDQGVPTVDGKTIYDIPDVHELQVTHPDDDHIGNASGFLKQMVENGSENIIGCTVSYCRIPDIIPEIEIEKQSQIRETWSGDKKSVINSLFYKAKYENPDWDTDMRLAGFTPVINLVPAEKDWEKEKIKAGGLGHEWLRYGTAGIKAFFGEDISNGSKPYVPTLTAATIYMESAFERFEVTLTQDKKKTIAKLKKNKHNLANIEIEVEMEQTLRDELTMKRQMPAFKWLEEIKKKWKGPNLLGPIGAALPLVALPRIVRKDSTMDIIEVTKRNDRPHFDSVRQVIQLGYDVLDLNKTIGFDPQLKTNVPKTGDAIDFKLANGTLVGRIETRGPDKEAYALMMRQIILARLHLFGADIHDPNVTLDGETVNRSSVVTLFERRDAQGTIFTMLFTGDAFDHACDITHTVMAWQSRAQPVIQFDVLKVPHHGSDNTTSSGFYYYCRAYVYLICGDHRNNHGNPKLSSLLAIIKGFKGLKAPGKKPFRIFFSNAHAKDNYNNVKSCFRGLLEGDKKYHPNQTDTSDFYFEMYYMKDLKNGKYAAFGSICFGKDKDNNLVTQWDKNQWVKV